MIMDRYLQFSLDIDITSLIYLTHFLLMGYFENIGTLFSNVLLIHILVHFLLMGYFNITVHCSLMGYLYILDTLLHIGFRLNLFGTLSTNGLL